MARPSARTLPPAVASPAELVRHTTVINVSAPELIAGSLRQAIILGVIKGGEKLRQNDIARQFGVSVIPVREAFQQLVAEGFVIGHRNRGVVVAETSTDEIRELFDLRAALESILLESAVPAMNAATFAEAKDYQARLEGETDTTRWGHWNWMFHETLYLPAQRPRTLKVVANVNLHIDRLLRVQMRLSAGARATGREHHGILRACEQRDVARALNLLEAHIRRVESILISFAKHEGAGGRHSMAKGNADAAAPGSRARRLLATN
jgi:DNA-binding GntR family transcriptional regulator